MGKKGKENPNQQNRPEKKPEGSSVPAPVAHAKTPQVPQDSGDQFEARLAKLTEMVGAGENPYANRFERKARAADVLAAIAAGPDEREFAVAGRIRSRRMMGKAGFMDLEDETGRIQLYGARDDIANFDLFKSLDLGDIVGVTGRGFVTKTGQPSIHLHSLILLSKCLRPLPVVKEADGRVFDAFADKEQRYRLRYVDLIVNPHVRSVFETRSRIIADIRSFLNEKGFLEVETPMMHPIPGGAAARPFVTHHNTLGMDLFLRIAPELYLKRLLVGGFAKVYEINRNFRNEGISYKHNPEFTMLELYEAYGDMRSMLSLCEELVVRLCRLIHGSLKIRYGDHELDFTPPWKQLPYLDAIKQYSGVELTSATSLEDAKAAARKAGIGQEALAGAGSVWKVAEVLFDEKVEERLVQPVFITRFPRELSPLAKTSPDDPAFVDRFEPYAVGRELGNAFSELNDPIDQKARFQAQVDRREAGDAEGGYMDHDYVRALEYAMPPAGGMGIGIDRLVMLLTDTHTIRDTILFPLLRPES